MHRLCALCLLCMLAEGCSSADNAITDCFLVRRYKKVSTPAFDLYVMNVRSQGGSRVDLYVQMQYDRLHFVKGASGYDASYSVVFVFRDKEGEAVQSREVYRSVNVPTYEASESQGADAFLQTVVVPPGRYVLQCTSVDQHSLVRYTQKSEVTAMDFSADSAMVSSMLLLMKPRDGRTERVLHPLFPQTLWHVRDSMGIFQELYGIRPGDTISVSMRYHVRSGAATAAVTLKTMVPPYSRFVASCAGGFDSTAYSSKAVLLAQRGGSISMVNFYPVPPAGYGEIERIVSIVRSNKIDRFVSRMPVYRAPTLELTLADVVDALRFIMRDEEIEALRNANDSLRALFIRQFWAGHGGAARGAEFEQRVDEANKLFSVCTEGSRTPMGITYIVCGQPEYVDCRSPYHETWYYTVGQQVMAVPFRLDPDNREASYYDLPFNSVNELLWVAFLDRWRRL